MKVYSNSISTGNRRKNSSEEVGERFDEVLWHDSKLLALNILKDSKSGKYDLELTIDLIISPSVGIFDRAKKRLVFEDARILRLDLDLLGVFMCGGDIAGATFHPEAVEFERRVRNQITEFDLPQDANPIDECFGFQLEMIHPGGDLIVFARDFKLL